MRLSSAHFALLLAGAWCVAATSKGANVQFDAGSSSDFTVAANWADDNPPVADGDVHFIENGLTADLTGTATVNGVVVGDISTGTLNINGGTLNVDVTAGFPQGFSIGGHLSNHTGFGVVNVTNGGTVNINLMGGSPDTGFVGERADGELHIGAGSTVNAPGIIWRIGQFGGFFGPPPPWDAVGVVTVEGTLNTRQLYVGVQGGHSEVTVSGNGSITLTGQLHSSIETFRIERLSTMRIVGSNASWQSDDIIANTQAGEVRNTFEFVTDSGGVSPFVAADAILFK
ncbi:MAG: hypothetical protein IT424_05375 [Pirellulales bacterium]|nr:hypothetical protein [Pirellulales bacterium]